MAIIVSDTFNRADDPSGLGTADTGQVWTTVGGNWEISSNQAARTNASSNSGRVVIETGTIDSITTVTLVNASELSLGAGNMGIIARYIDTSHYYHLTYEAFPGPAYRLRLHKTKVGVFTLYDQVITLSDGDTIGLGCCGDQFDVYVNGVLQASILPTPGVYGTQSGLTAYGGTIGIDVPVNKFDNFLVETDAACGSRSASPSASPSATPTVSPSSSPSASPTPCTPPEGSAISCINSKGRLFVTLQNVDNDQITYAWHEGAERMPITSMTNWKRSLRALTLQELNIAFETDNADVNDPLIVSVHRNLRKNYARDGRTALGSGRIDSASFGFDADNIGDMIAICGENIGGPGVDYLIGRIALLGSPGPSPSPSSSISPSPSSTASASPSLSPSASPSSSRSSSASPSHSPSASPSSSPSLSPSPSASPSASSSSSPSSSSSASPSASA